ncbi:MAG TPA: DinB family protein [Methylomirabilota bacterium]|nr:DinB family protein [Methylomirabilota bacterium]
MDTRIIASLYEYGEWANERLLAVAAKLTDAERRRRWSQGYQSIHETFVHLLGADLRWFARWQDAPLPPILTADDVPSLDAIRERWAPLAAERRTYLAGLRAEDLHHVIRGRFADGQTYELPRWQGILQCANHGTQHRSEVAAMLTDAGHSPGDLDYSRFCQPRP